MYIFVFVLAFAFAFYVCLLPYDDGNNMSLLDFFFLPVRHHAKKGEAAGFCYVNDGVLAVLHLTKTFGTVLTIDIGEKTAGGG